MLTSDWINEFSDLQHHPGITFFQDFELTRKTSMKMQARAALFASVESPLALRQLLLRARQLDIPYFMLGGGKNTLFATSYFDGLVISLGRNFSTITRLNDNCIRAGAGVQLPKLIRFSHECNLMGFEFLTQVPGTVGGGLAGNAGAGNWGLCEFVDSVYLMSREGFIACVKRNQFRYSYRHSDLRDAILLEADFRLEPLKRFEADRRIEEFKSKKVNQPYHIPSSGCIFKNPKDSSGKSVSAGKLIDDCGLKGYRIRSAMVDQGHANFIVNEGESTGEDFLALITLVRDIVKAKTNIELDLEVQIVGGPLTTAILS